MIKVGLIGTHGTRKTTACLDIALSLKKIGINARILEEVVRELPRLPGFDINEGTTRESQEWILYTQMADELKYGARRDIDFLICDRSNFDNYMYYVYKFGHSRVLDVLMNDWIKSYKLLFKLPIIKESPLESDYTRAIDPLFQKGIDDLLERELAERKIPFERYTTAESAIEKIMALKEIKNGKL